MAKELPKIPSEYIEPYLAKFIGHLIESIAFGFKTPAEAKTALEGVEEFVSLCGGLHSEMAMMNELGRFKSISDDELLHMCKKIGKIRTQNS